MDRAEYDEYVRKFRETMDSLEGFFFGAMPGCVECGLPYEYWSELTGWTTDDDAATVYNSGTDVHVDGAEVEELLNNTFVLRKVITEADVDERSAGFMTSLPCDICGNDVDGEKVRAHAWDETGALIHLNVCNDCVHFEQFGQLDDQTMAEVECGQWRG